MKKIFFILLLVLMSFSLCQGHGRDIYPSSNRDFYKPAIGINHNLLSVTHSDTTTDSPSRGSVIISNSTPEWDEITISTSIGTALTKVLGTDGTDSGFRTLANFADDLEVLIDHGSLAGLGDQADHAWTLLIDGSRPLTANWPVGNKDITGIAALAAETGDIGESLTVNSNETNQNGIEVFGKGFSELALGGFLKLWHGNTLNNDGGPWYIFANWEDRLVFGQSAQTNPLTDFGIFHYEAGIGQGGLGLKIRDNLVINFNQDIQVGLILQGKGTDADDRGGFIQIDADETDTDNSFIWALPNKLVFNMSTQSSSIDEGVFFIDTAFGGFSAVSKNFVVGNTGVLTTSAQIIIDSTGTEALLVRKNGDTGDILTVDTTNEIVRFGTNGTFSAAGAIVGTLLAIDNITINGAAITSNTGTISFGDENLTTTGDIRLLSNSNRLEIGATAGGDFTIAHDGTDTTMTNTTGDLKIVLPASGSIKVDGATNAFDISGGSGLSNGNEWSRTMTGTIPDVTPSQIIKANKYTGILENSFSGNITNQNPMTTAHAFSGTVSNSTWIYDVAGKGGTATPELTCLDVDWELASSFEIENTTTEVVEVAIVGLNNKVRVDAVIKETAGTLIIDMIAGRFEFEHLGSEPNISGTPILNFIGGEFIGTGETSYLGAGTPVTTSIGGRFTTGSSITNKGILILAISDSETLNVGLDIEAVSGSTTNFAIRTSTGLVAFGDTLIVGGTTPDSLFEVDGAMGLAIQTVTGNTTLDKTHSTLLVNASGNVIISLPTAASAYNSTDGIGRIYRVKKIDLDADTVTVDGAGSETIDGGLTAILTVQYETIAFQSDGSNWHIL